MTIWNEVILQANNIYEDLSCFQKMILSLLKVGETTDEYKNRQINILNTHKLLKVYKFESNLHYTLWTQLITPHYIFYFRYFHECFHAYFMLSQGKVKGLPQDQSFQQGLEIEDYT